VFNRPPTGVRVVQTSKSPFFYIVLVYLMVRPEEFFFFGTSGISRLVASAWGRPECCGGVTHRYMLKINEIQSVSCHILSLKLNIHNIEWDQACQCWADVGQIGQNRSEVQSLTLLRNDSARLNRHFLIYHQFPIISTRNLIRGDPLKTGLSNYSLFWS
jgi:hypothetical protein